MGNNIKYNNVIDEENIILNSKLNSKEQAIDVLSELLVASGAVLNKKKFIDDIYEREKKGFTFAGDYLAIPHGSSTCVIQPQIAIAKTDTAFMWDKNRNLVKLIIMFAIPEDTEKEKELEFLGNIASSLGDVELVKGLLKVNTKEGLLQLIYRYVNNQ